MLILVVEMHERIAAQNIGGKEVSMISAQLFEFISNMLATIHNNTLAFGGINVIVVADKINHLVCNTLLVTEVKFMISNAIYIINGEQWYTNLTEKLESKTNLSASIKLQGAKVMYLNNSKANLNIYNGTIGVITDVNAESN
ncbi:hypothetical protein C1645_830343 [Glomus cerebriforme]|uniref:Uncharacterized protein n=1 Tax=Glomus cerebriforme TaxID=658196 RepID=A0A397SSD0_9GLOM|nr:hypothetical protein C1645_830343 [Glomus cerebriforme]